MPTTLSAPDPTRHRIPAEADLDLIRLANDSGLAISVSPNGVPFAIRHGGTLINRALVSSAENGWFRLLARLTPLAGGAPQIVDLLDPGAGSTFARLGPEACQWSGQSHDLAIDVTLRLSPIDPAWAWTIECIDTGDAPRRIEIFYGQDLGLGDEGAVRNNEAYLSQYLDHHVAESPALGPVVLTRQNMPMAKDLHPWIAQGCREGAVAFCTDGFQFFGLGSKAGAVPLALGEAGLPSSVRQFEFAYPGLQSRPVELQPCRPHRATFFAAFEPDHPEPSSSTDLESLAARLEFLDAPTDDDLTAISFRPGPTAIVALPPVNGRDLDDAGFAKFFPGDRRNEEFDDGGRLLSFFHGADRHVVTGRKENRMVRAHGHILWGGSGLAPDARALGTTVYANGVFNAQTYFANPNFGRFLSVVRCPLNQLRLNGQRVFVEIDGEWRQLGIPSTFEIGPRHVRWLYQLADRTIQLTTWCGTDVPAVYLQMTVIQGPESRLLVTHQLVPGENEFSTTVDVSVNETEAWATGTPGASATVLDEIPGYAFLIAAADPEAVAGISTGLRGDDGSEHPGFLTLESHPTRSLSVILAACDGGAFALEEALPDLRETALAGCDESAAFRDTHGGGLRLSSEGSNDAARLDEVIPWCAHNAWIHFATPHGLEQYNGGAWGVRDVCQGSVEWLLAVDDTAAVRKILTAVFSQQYRVDPVWPQWFMQPPFGKIQQAHSHGDIPFWPLKALCDYLEVTQDYVFLDAPLPYANAETFKSEAPAESVTQHIDRILAHFHSRCVPGTALVNYGDGDWDDTLQPADPVLRSSMVSTWTVALSYHVFRQYRDVCTASGQDERAAELTDLLDRIAADFRRHLMPGGITCGFAVVEDDGQFRPLLHPEDSTSGIRYRLLPMTRAILAGLFNREEADRHLRLIREHLLFPDGVHLMSDPVQYRGGVSHQYKRAETAAYFGREVGLQYVHAHIRYAEALAEMGLADEAWRAMSTVNPVGISAAVPNATLRQSNAYFSSSDAEFSDRYEASRRFDELRRGEIPVSGGWRIYSSGPGIFLHKIVTRLAGMRELHGDIVFAPMLSTDRPRLVLQRTWRGHELEITATREANCSGRLVVNGSPCIGVTTDDHPYRNGGIRVSTAPFLAQLKAGLNRVEIITDLKM